jgi:hypothetical protein
MDINNILKVKPNFLPIAVQIRFKQRPSDKRNTRNKQNRQWKKEQ